MPEVVFNKDDLAFSRKAAADSFVLLKNDNVLPISKDTKTALFGRTQFDTWKGGYGAADLWAVPVFPFAKGIFEAGNVYMPLYRKYEAFCDENHKKFINCTDDKNDWVESLEEMPLCEKTVVEASNECKVAIIFIGRVAGEHRDWKDVCGQYRLTEREEEMLRMVTEHFEKTVLVFNIPSLMDISFLKRYRFDAILHTFLPGMEAGHALADVIYGDATPNGRMPDSWAEACADYPSTKGEVTSTVVYEEGLYLGYRYFDSFEKQVVFPFGFGLSYTDFNREIISIDVSESVVSVSVQVTNTGNYKGRDVVQCYLSSPDGKLEKPYQALCGFEKTDVLLPSQSQTLNITVDLRDFSSYCEKSAAYLLEAGDYVLRIGTSSRDTAPICIIRIDSTVICRKVTNCLTPKLTVKLLQKTRKSTEDTNNIPIFTPQITEALSALIYQKPQEAKPAKPCRFEDVQKSDRTIEELVSQLTDEELTLLLSGDCERKRLSYGLKSEGELISGEGTHSHKAKRLGIPSTVMQDGPAGIRLSAFQIGEINEKIINGKDCICYPSSTSIAATWDKSIALEIGRHIVRDMDRYRLPGWCAPGVNLHRSPLCGRNFEYFSEDPYLSAQMAIKEIEGIQERPDGSPTGHYAVLKHFAFNETETLRMESDSVMTERTARELYLRSFDYVIHEKPPLSIMTSYNKINGTYTAASYDLCSKICKGEWGFDGLIMSDWDISAEPADCINAGNDILMPGLYIPLDLLQNGTINRAMAQQCAVHLIRLLLKTMHYK